MIKQTVSPTKRRQLTVLRQFVELIPGHLVARLARHTGAAAMGRSFSAWSHVVALLSAQLAHAESLNDVCDALRLWRTPLAAIRGATPPSRNNLSHANRERPCAMAEQLFWAVLGHRELCADLHEGEIVLFDKAYVDFAHLWDLAERGVSFVTRQRCPVLDHK